ncbi:MAG: hypothetical protein V4596_10985 [Bdellovibrionota bacterium]
MKIGTILLILLVLGTLSSQANEGLQCSSLFREGPKEQPHFENGHNVPLKNIMQKMKELEDNIREFVDGLTPKNFSKYIPDNSAKYRNLEALKEILDIADTYEKILNHLVEHSDHMMMSPRIQMIPAEKREAFVEKYKQSYVNYLATFQRLKYSLENMEGKDPSTWNNLEAQNILMELHGQMGAAHNKF